MLDGIAVFGTCRGVCFRDANRVLRSIGGQYEIANQLVVIDGRHGCGLGKVVLGCKSGGLELDQVLTIIILNSEEEEIHLFCSI